MRHRLILTEQLCFPFFNELVCIHAFDVAESYFDTNLKTFVMIAKCKNCGKNMVQEYKNKITWDKSTIMSSFRKNRG